MSAIRGDKFNIGGAYALLAELIPRSDTAEADAAVLLLAHTLFDLYAARKS